MSRRNSGYFVSHPVNPIIIKYPSGDKRVLVARPMEDAPNTNSPDTDLSGAHSDDDVFQ